MRKLKNWTITAESIKNTDAGFISYINYLTDQNQHKNQKITPYTPRKNAERMAKVAASFNLERKMNGGGRPSGFGWSAVLSYPFNIDETLLRVIFENNAREFLEYVSYHNELGLTEEQINSIVQERVYAVEHRGKNVKNHVHIVFPKHFIKDGKIVSIDLTQKKYVLRLKLINNQSVHKIAHRDLFDYQIQTQKTQKKRKSKTQYKQEQRKVISEELDELLNELKKQMKAYESKGVRNEKELKRLERAKTQLKNGNTQRARKTLFPST